VPTHIALGRSAGLSEDQIAHLVDDPLPESVYTPAEAVTVRYARASTRMQAIDDDLYCELQRHFDVREIMELWFIVSIANTANRFHLTFHTPLDDSTKASFAAGCPLPLPPEPGSDRRDEIGS
jgi:alkylhydroperoxidase family enzyme